MFLVYLWEEGSSTSFYPTIMITPQWSFSFENLVDQSPNTELVKNLVSSQALPGPEALLDTA